VTANQFITFQAAAMPGYRVSFGSIGKFDYRRSSTGPANGVLQYQIGSGAFVDIAPLSYSSTASTGGSLSPINLTGIPALQNVGPGTNVTFRVVNYGGGSSGTWYVYDVSNSPAVDFEIEGTVSTTNVPDLAITLAQAASFSQGDVGDAYSINVTNVGSAASSGSVTVTAVPPPGFVITSIGGAGWVADLNTLSCTRSESLGAGAGYPPINVLVNVATNAAAALTNSVVVSGGNDANLANNTDSRLTSVTALTPIQRWRLYWFGTTSDSGTAADSAVAANDQMPNLLKYALGLNPLVVATNPVAGDIATGYLRLTSPKNPDATDVIFSAEITHSLASSWSTNGVVIDQNTPTFFEARELVPVSGGTNSFMRLKVIRP
jgi:hypothetical protein